MKVNSFKPFGGEVLEVDLNDPLTDTVIKGITDALIQNHVIAIRNQHISPARFLEFSKRFGNIQPNGHPVLHKISKYALTEHPEVLVISNIKDADGNFIGMNDAGLYWHSDSSYAERPALGALLYSQEVPTEGGERF